MSKTDEFVATQALNQRFVHHDLKVELVPYEHPRMLVRAQHKLEAAIAADRKLSGEGKDDAIKKSKATARAAIIEWNEARKTALAAHDLELRAALFANVERPDPKRIELMQQHLLKHTPADLAVFYHSATEAERREMEAASAVIGRVPVVGANGKEWLPLLDPEMVQESILARAEQTNPTAAQKVREMAEIQAMQKTITGVALSEI